jgi:hypothetical protein
VRDFTAKSPFLNDFLVTLSISLSRPFPLAVLLFLLYRIDNVMVKVAETEKSRFILDGILAAASRCVKMSHVLGWTFEALGGLRAARKSSGMHLHAICNNFCY